MQHVNVIYKYTIYFRKRAFKDFHRLDVVFDAGGRVSLSLTAVTVTSQLLWPADFLQSPTVCEQGFKNILLSCAAILIFEFRHNYKTEHFDYNPH